MEPLEVIFYGGVAIDLILKLSLPCIIAATVVGLVVAVVQAGLQLQEQTLAFLCKLLAIGFTFAVTGTWFGAKLIGFLSLILDQFPSVTQ
ncbi:MAG: flagellar biosynthetic protein FliQ [Halopseudomonas aestusnigri]